MYVLQYTESNMGLRKCTSEDHLSRRVLHMQAANLVLKREENNFFSGSDGGLSRGVWTGHSLVSPRDKFNVDLVDTLRAFKAAACLMCPATAPLLNPTPASVHWPQQLRTFPFLNENIITVDGLCQELPAFGIPCSCGMCFI